MTSQDNIDLYLRTSKKEEKDQQLYFGVMKHLHFKDMKSEEFTLFSVLFSEGCGCLVRCLKRHENIRSCQIDCQSLSSELGSASSKLIQVLAQRLISGN